MAARLHEIHIADNVTRLGNLVVRDERTPKSPARRPQLMDDGQTGSNPSAAKSAIDEGVKLSADRLNRRDEDNVTRLEIVFLLLFMTMAAPLLHAERLHSQNSPKKDMDLGECVVKTPGNTVTVEITIHFETKQPTDNLNVIIVFANLQGVILPLANVHATYIAEERYNLTARVGQQAMIGEYCTASPLNKEFSNLPHRFLTGKLFI